MKKNISRWIGTAGLGALAAGAVLWGAGCDGGCPFSSCGAAEITTQKNTKDNKMEKAQWFTDFDAAKKQAAAEKKKIFILFTGSDWCPWCMKLQKEVLSQPQFITWANDNAVLLMVDFPRGGNQTDALKNHNEQLARQFGVEGFPTVILTDANGKPIGKTGYQRGGAADYVTHLKSLIQ